MDSDKYNRSITLHCPTCGGTDFASASTESEVVKCANCALELTKDDLIVLRELMQSGKISPVIDKTYKLDQTAAAVRYLEQGHARGKVVVTIE